MISGTNTIMLKVAVSEMLWYYLCVRVGQLGQ